MATIEERVKAITARVLKLDPDQIKAEHSFTADLGAGRQSGRIHCGGLQGTGRCDRGQRTEDRGQMTEDR